jgi:hypothetical protein
MAKVISRVFKTAWFAKKARTADIERMMALKDLMEICNA